MSPAELRPFRIAGLKDEARGIRSFFLAPADARPAPPHLAGQHLPVHLAPGPDAPRLRRTYTISSAPGDPDGYRITVKREGGDPPGAGGAASRLLHDTLGLGAEVMAEAPAGRFHVELADGAAPLVLVSAGVGITPMMSIVEHEAALRRRRSLLFVHGARDRASHAFAGRLGQLAATLPGLRLRTWYSRPRPHDRAGPRFDEGRVPHREVADAVDGDGHVFLCGPPAFMRAIRRGLLERGLPDGRIHTELFQAPDRASDAAAPPTRAAAAAAGHRVTFARSGLTVVWDGTHAGLLDLAEAHGLVLSHSCRSGFCLTCQQPLVSGEVGYPEPPVIDPDPGCALLCIGRPASDLVIDA